MQSKHIRPPLEGAESVPVHCRDRFRGRTYQPKSNYFTTTEKEAVSQTKLIRLFPLILLAALFLLHPPKSHGQDTLNAEEIVREATQKMRGETSKAEMQMKIIRPGWQRTLSMKTWTKGTKYAMILITAPAREEGTAYLKRGSEIWNWVPRIGRTVKLPPSMMKQSWMGSDFTNDDLIKESSLVTDYNHKIVGNTTLHGRSSYHLRLTPKPKAPVVWGGLELWVSKEHFLQLRTEYYNPNGELIDIMTGSEIKEMDGRLITSKLVMRPANKEGHRTVLIYESITFNEPIPTDFFTVPNMKRLDE